MIAVSSFGFLPESFWFYVTVDKRSKRIHDENGERHTLWIGSPVADDDGEQSDTNAIDELTLRRHGRGDIVGCHEDGTQQQSATQDDGGGSSIGGIDEVHHAAKQKDGADDADRDVPRDNLTPQHEGEAEEQRQREEAERQTAREAEQVAGRNRRRSRRNTEEMFETLIY